MVVHALRLRWHSTAVVGVRSPGKGLPLAEHDAGGEKNVFHSCAIEAGVL